MACGERESGGESMERPGEEKSEPKRLVMIGERRVESQEEGGLRPSPTPFFKSRRSDQVDVSTQKSRRRVGAPRLQAEGKRKEKKTDDQLRARGGEGRGPG